MRIPFLQQKLFTFFTEFFAEIDSIFLKLWKGNEEVELSEEIHWQDINFKQVQVALKALSDRKLNGIILKNLKLKCHELNFAINYGWSNPALTGIMNGIIWGILGVLFSRISSIIAFQKKPDLNVKPDFYHEKFDLNLSGIFSLYIGNIIVTIWIVLIYKIRGGKRPWENILLKN